MGNYCDCIQCSYGKNWIELSDVAKKLNISKGYLYNLLNQWALFRSKKFKALVSIENKYNGHNNIPFAKYLLHVSIVRVLQEKFIDVTKELNKISKIKRNPLKLDLSKV
jgi:hypothetical protein